MGFIDFFVEREEKPSKPIKKNAVPPQQVVATAMIEPIVHTSSSVSLYGPEYQKFKEQFAKILAEENKRNFPGHDYYEFKEIKDKMNMIPSETTKYEASFGAWCVNHDNGTKVHLLSTANQYLSIVDREIQDFEKEYQAHYNAQVGDTEKVIELKSKEVAEAVEKINKLNAEISELKKKNIDSTARLTSSHDSFMAAGKAQKEEILAEINNITNYVK